MNTFSRALTLAAALAAAPLAAAAAGQAGASGIGTYIYSPSPLIVHSNAAQPPVMASRGDAGIVVRRTRVKLADKDNTGTAIYQPGPLTTETRRERIITGINEAYGTSFATHPANQALAMNN